MYSKKALISNCGNSTGQVSGSSLKWEPFPQTAIFSLCVSQVQSDKKHMSAAALHLQYLFSLSTHILVCLYMNIFLSPLVAEHRFSLLSLESILGGGWGGYGR